MDEGLSSYLPLQAIEALAAMPYGWLIVPLAICLLTASVVTFSVPGTFTPVAFLGGALLGIPAILVVALGAALGSHFLFVASRYWLRGYMDRKFGHRIEPIQSHLAKRGPLYVIGLRFGGTPHIALTAACAATPISARQFGIATLIGMTPAIVLGSMAGHAII